MASAAGSKSMKECTSTLSTNPERSERVERAGIPCNRRRRARHGTQNRPRGRLSSARLIRSLRSGFVEPEYDRPMFDLTWPALLGHWTAFAQNSLALPKTADGDRWRAAVPAIIGLQALTHALGDL